MVDEGSIYIWYGPAGRDGDATHAEFIDDEYVVSEYVGTEGLLEEAPGPILKTTTRFSVEELLTASVEAQTRAAVWSAIERHPEDQLRLAVGYGTTKIFHQGGDEEFVDELP